MVRTFLTIIFVLILYYWLARKGHVLVKYKEIFMDGQTLCSHIRMLYWERAWVIRVEMSGIFLASLKVTS